MITGWEYRPLDRAYLSLPVVEGPRYRVRRQGPIWDARRIEPGARLAGRNINRPLGRFTSPESAMRACQAHEAERLNGPENQERLFA